MKAHRLFRLLFFEFSVKFLNELLVLTDVVPTILCPGLVLGGWFGYWDLLFNYDKTTGEIEFPGNVNKRIPTVHINDLADCYARVASAPHGAVANEVFIVTSSSREHLITIWTVLATAAGANGKVKNVPALQAGFLAMMENMDMVASSSKARRILGWKPKHASAMEDAKGLYRQYVAWKKVREARA